MNILVCISKVPDTTTKISFNSDNTEFNGSGVQWVINPSDEWYALVRALEIKETAGGKVTVINVGRAENEPIIRKALAIGADDAVRIDADETDALSVAKYLADYAKSQEFDLIITGKETIDYNGGIVGAAIAEYMDYNLLSMVSKLELTDKTITAERDIEGGVEVIQAELPVVITANKGLAEARIPNMRGIMSARTKPLNIVEVDPLDPKTSIANYSLPPAKEGVKLIDPENVQELVRLLHEEAKMI